MARGGERRGVGAWKGGGSEGFREGRLEREREGGGGEGGREG